MLKPNSNIPTSAIYAFADIVEFGEFDLLLVESVLAHATMEELLQATYNVGKLKNVAFINHVTAIDWQDSGNKTRISFALPKDNENVKRQLLIDPEENVSKAITIQEDEDGWVQQIKIFSGNGVLLGGENSTAEGPTREIVYKPLSDEDRGFTEGEWRYFSKGKLTETEVSVLANSNKDDSEFHVYGGGELRKRVIVNNHNKHTKYTHDLMSGLEIIHDPDGDPLQVTFEGKVSIINYAVRGTRKLLDSLTTMESGSDKVNHYLYNYDIVKTRPVSVGVYIGQSYDNHIEKVRLAV